MRRLMEREQGQTVEEILRRALEAGKSLCERMSPWRGGKDKISNKRLSRSAKGEDSNEAEQRGSGRGLEDPPPGDPTGRPEAKGDYGLSAGPERRSSAICAI